MRLRKLAPFCMYPEQHIIAGCLDKKALEQQKMRPLRSPMTKETCADKRSIPSVQLGIICPKVHK